MTEPLTYTQSKDGAIVVKDTEGKDVRYTKESDLLTVKGSADTAIKAVEKAAKTAQEEATKALEASSTALDASKAEVAAANTKFDETAQKLLQAEAERETLKEEVTKSAGSVVELTKAKADLENATKSVGELTTKALEYRRNVIVTTFGVSADVVKDKTVEQLDAFEEALKAVAAAKGIGNYAAGGATGGGAVPEKPLDRAKRILAESEAAGHLIGGGGSSFKKPEQD